MGWRTDTILVRVRSSIGPDEAASGKKVAAYNGSGTAPRKVQSTVFNTILENYKEKSFQKWFWNLSHVFGSGHKVPFKKTIFDVFCRFYGLTSDAIFSVI